MDLQIKKFKDLTEEQVTNYLNEINNYGLYHSPAVIKYQLSTKPSCENLSFFCFDNKIPLAFVPLGIYEKNTTKKISFGETSCHLPALNIEISSNLKKKVLDEIFKRIHLIMKNKNIDYADFFYHPIFAKKLSSKRTTDITYSNSFTILKYFQMEVVTNNTNIVDLRVDKKELENNLQARKRKEFKKEFYNQLKFIKINKSNSSSSEIEHYFKNYKDIHFKSSGKKTRQEKSWFNYLQMIKDGISTLFFLSYKDELISGIICLDFHDYSVAASQASLKKENYLKYSIRSFLEWNVINSYKNRKFKFYEIGQTFYFDQKHHNAIDEKHKRIGDFKTRFGANMFPRHYFRIKKKFKTYYEKI